MIVPERKFVLGTLSNNEIKYIFPYIWVGDKWRVNTEQVVGRDRKERERKGERKRKKKKREKKKTIIGKKREKDAERTQMHKPNVQRRKER